MEVLLEPSYIKATAQLKHQTLAGRKQTTEKYIQEEREIYLGKELWVFRQGRMGSLAFNAQQSSKNLVLLKYAQKPHYKHFVVMKFNIFNWNRVLVIV